MNKTTNKEIKILQISDIHWRGNSRHEEYTNAFELLFEKAREIKPDFILNTGDVFHTKNTGITHEVNERMAWMIRSCDKIAPSRLLLGNHDGNLKNDSKQDALTPIFKAIGDDPRNKLFKLSGNYEEEFDERINWCVFSCFDKEGWSKVKPIDGKINIALFHGSISGCIIGDNHNMQNGEESISSFAEYDFTLMGDIHKTQFMSYKQDKFGKGKPNSGYPGSLIQQNFGEDERKGFLLWTIRDSNDWDVEFIEIENLRPFFTIEWQGGVKSTIDFIINKRKEIKLGSRIRILSDKKITSIEAKLLTETLKDQYKAEEVSFKVDSKADTMPVKAGTLTIQKDALKTNSEVISDLYKEFLSLNKKKNGISDEQTEDALNKIKSYIKTIEEQNPEESMKNVTWNLKKLEFDNLFRYAEGNCINFDSLNGLVGLFGLNRRGKSSIPGSLMYSLFNTTDRGPMKTGHIIHEGTNECKTKVQFEMNGEDFFIERSSTLEEHKKKNTEDPLKTATSLNFYKIDQFGSVISKNGQDRDETDKNIRKIIGNADEFLLTNFSSQGDISKFIDEGATKRKEFLSKFLNLDIFKDLSVLAKEDLNELNSLAKKYSNINFDEEIKNLSNKINETKSLIEFHENNIIETEKLLEKTKRNLFVIESNNDFDSIRILEREFETKEVEYNKGFKEKEMLEREMVSLETKLNEIKLKLNEFDIDSLSLKIEKIQELKSLASEIQGNLKLESNILDTQEKSIKKLSIVPCGDSFPTCIHIKDSHENNKLILNQREKVKDLNVKLKEFETEFKIFVEDKTIEKYKACKQLKEEQISTENKLNVLIERNNNNDISKLLKDKNFLMIKINELKSKVDKNVVEEKETLNEKYSVLTKEIRQHVDSKNSSMFSLGSLTEKLETSILQQNELSKIIDKTNIQQTIYNAFSKTGIPTMVLESQMPAINFELNKILTGVTDFGIELSTSSGVNSMDIYITNGKSKRIIETASGMEKMICSLALRVALTNVSCLPKSNIFIIDEGFGVLDENNVQLCLQMLNVLKSYYKTILLITHIPEVKEIVEHIIDIKDFSGESFVYVP